MIAPPSTSLSLRVSIPERQTSTKLLILRCEWDLEEMNQGFPSSSVCKESACNVGDLGSIPESGRSPGGGHGNPHQYSCLENPHGQRGLGGLQSTGSQRVGHNSATKHKAPTMKQSGKLQNPPPYNHTLEPSPPTTTVGLAMWVALASKTSANKQQTEASRSPCAWHTPSFCT